MNTLITCLAFISVSYGMLFVGVCLDDLERYSLGLGKSTKKELAIQAALLPFQVAWIVLVVIGYGLYSLVNKVMK